MSELPQGFVLDKPGIGSPIDLTRPKIQNPDGTFSTEETITVQGSDGQWHNVPTIIDGKRVDPDEVQSRFEAGDQSITSVGSFPTVDEAVSAAKARTNEIGRVREPANAQTLPQGFTLDAQPTGSQNPDFPNIKPFDAENEDIPKGIAKRNEKLLIAKELGIKRPNKQRRSEGDFFKFEDARPFTDDEFIKHLDTMSSALPAVQGFSFATADEITRKLESLTLGDGADAKADERKALLEFRRKTAPKRALVSEIVGGVASPIAKALVPLKAVKGGAAGGALYAGGSAEGNLVERADDAIKGGLIGAGFGAMLFMAGPVLSRLRNLKPQDKLSRAESILLKEVQRQNNVDKQGALALIANTSDDDAALAFQKLNLQELAEGTSTLGGRSRQIFEDAVRKQQAGQQQRISTGVKNIIGAKDFSSLKNKIGEKLAAEGSELYTAAFSQDFKVTGKLANLMTRPSMQKALVKANKFAADEGTSLAGNELQFFHHAKGALDDMIGASLKNNTSTQTKSLMSLKTELLKEMDTIPQYAQARKLWAGQKANENALEFGRKALSQRQEDVAQAVAGFSEGERQHMLAGLLQGVDDRLRKSASTHNATVKFNAEEVRGVFRAVLSEKQANKITALLERESALTATGRRVRADLGSATAPKQVAAARVASQSRGGVRQVVHFVSENGVQPIQSAIKYIRVLAGRVAKEDPAVIEALAIKLAGTPEEVAAVFARLSPSAQQKVHKIYRMGGGQGAFIAGATPAIVEQNTKRRVSQR
ncbi:MAG: hypothetical protein COB36_11630 [Alphaproteobacteria bacterium]|nr:MAG: hypothetical protein COB36_11630 [Alphaproteobacteria bacterium]